MKNKLKHIILVLLLLGCSTTQHSWKKGEPDPISITIYELLQSGKQVRIVVIGNAETPIHLSEYEQWQRYTVSLISSHIESDLSPNSAFGKRFKNLKLIERGILQTLLKEQHFSLTGAVTQEYAISVGKMIGATHIYYFNHLRTLSEYSTNDNPLMKDNSTRKIIDVETGQVLSSAWSVTEE